MILNLTQHKATNEQVSQGVIDIVRFEPVIADLLTFSHIPTEQNVTERASKLANLATETNCSTAMIGGALFLMGPLIEELEKKGIEAIYAFSKRTVEEKDGKKISIFKHEGFVKPSGGEWRRAEKICPVDEKKCDWYYGKLFPQCRPSCKKFPTERCALLEKNGDESNAAFERNQARMLQKNYNGGGKPIPEESEMRLRGTMTSE